VRVHTVGDQLFATRVHSETVDYRYSGREGGKVRWSLRSCRRPLRESCLKLARELDLVL